MNDLTTSLDYDTLNHALPANMTIFVMEIPGN